MNTKRVGMTILALLSVTMLMSASRSLETNITSLLTIDNQLYIVPNSEIWGDVT